MAYTLITGASSGIGRATAVKLAAAGRNLILSGRNEAALQKTSDLCAGTHTVWPMDLWDCPVVDWIRAICEARSIDAFVHCAGICNVAALRDSAEGPLMMRINFEAGVEILTALSRHLINGKALTAAVFVSSTASQFGARGMAWYCASKGALDAFMRAAAVELAPRIRVNSVLPGGIPTPMSAHMPTTSAPLPPGTVDDVANAIEFLLSDKSRWITGTSLVVDGGRTVDITA